MLVAVVALYTFFHLPFFSVSDIQLVGPNSDTTVSSLQKLKGVSIFSSDVTRTVNQIKDNDLTISDLSCSRGIPSTLRCAISLRSPALIWKQGPTLYLVDNNGFIYGTTASAASDQLIVEDRSVEPLGLGKTVASADIIQTYQQAKTELTKRGFAVTNLYVADTLYQVGAVVTGNGRADVNWHPKQPINFLLVTSYPVSTQADVLLATTQSKPDKITERVDVRVPGYVYTK